MNIEHPKRASRPSEIANCVGACLKEGDLDGILKMFHPECVVYFPPGEEPKKGLAAVRELFEPFAAMRPTLVSEVTGTLINDDTALLQAKWQIKGPDGSVISEGNSTEVAKKDEDGFWVYYIDCPMGPPAFLPTLEE